MKIYQKFELTKIIEYSEHIDGSLIELKSESGRCFQCFTDYKKLEANKFHFVEYFSWQAGDDLNTDVMLTKNKEFAKDMTPLKDSEGYGVQCSYRVQGQVVGICRGDIYIDCGVLLLLFDRFTHDPKVVGQWVDLNVYSLEAIFDGEFAWGCPETRF